MIFAIDRPESQGTYGHRQVAKFPKRRHFAGFCCKPIAQRISEMLQWIHYSAPYAAIQFAGRWGEKTGPRAGFFVFKDGKTLRTACFVDGYNLLYGLLAGTPYKWLDLPGLLAHVIRSESPDSIVKDVSFFTSGVMPSLARQGTVSKEAQDSYIRALKARNVEVFYGRHQLEPRFAPAFVSKKIPASRDNQVHIWKLEEKETDVHIAIRMYRRVVRDLALPIDERIEQIVLVSADTDMTPALQALREDFPGISLGLILPHREGAKRTLPGSLINHVQWVRKKVSNEELASHQFPVRMPTRKKPIDKPGYW